MALTKATAQETSEIIIIDLSLMMFKVMGQMAPYCKPHFPIMRAAHAV